MADNRKNLLSRRNALKTIAGISTVGLAGCGGGAGGGGTGTATTTAVAPDNLTFAGGASTGTAQYAGAVTWGEIAKEVWPDVKTTVQTGGGESNMARLQRGDIDFGWSFSSAMNQAHAGTGNFTESLSDIRFAVTLWPAYVIAAATTDISSYADLEGKSIAPGKKGFTGYAAAIMVLNEYELTEDDFEIVTAGYPEMPSLYKDGIADSVHVAGTRRNHPVMSNLFAQKTGNLLPVKEDVQQTIADEKLGWSALSLPADSYPDAANGGEEVPTVGMGMSVGTHKDAPENVVYELVKRTYDNLDTLSEAHAAHKDTSVDVAPNNRGEVPYHPGAERALSELGAI